MLFEINALPISNMSICIDYFSWGLLNLFFLVAFHLLQFHLLFLLVSPSVSVNVGLFCCSDFSLCWTLFDWIWIFFVIHSFCCIFNRFKIHLRTNKKCTYCWLHSLLDISYLKKQKQTKLYVLMHLFCRHGRRV